MAKGILKKLVSQQALERPPFMPLLYSYAAKLIQVPALRVLTSPALLTRALSTAYELIRPDMLVFPYDPTLEAEALGAPVQFRPEAAPLIEEPCLSTIVPPDQPIEILIQKGRLSIICETLNRLKTQVGRDVDIVAGITGPLTMAFQLRGKAFNEDFKKNQLEARRFLEFTGQVATRIIRNYGEIGVDGILLVESCFSWAGQDMMSALKSVSTPLLNTCNYYEIPVVFYPDTLSEALRVVLPELPWSGYILQDPEINGPLAHELLSKGRCVGLPVNLENSVEQPGKAVKETIEKYKKISDKSGVFFTTRADPCHQVQVESLHEVMKCLIR